MKLHTRNNTIVLQVRRVLRSPSSAVKIKEALDMTAAAKRKLQRGAVHNLQLGAAGFAIVVGTAVYGCVGALDPIGEIAAQMADMPSAETLMATLLANEVTRFALKKILDKFNTAFLTYK